MHKIIQKAFTLVELLVVIAIIGILSGLIIVGMSASVSNANLAKAQIFSTSLRDSLLGNIVSEWKFDELTVPAMEGQSARDTWSTNNCTLYTGLDGLDKLRTGSSCLYDKCLALDGSNDYLDCGNSDNFDFPQEFTYEAWIYPTVFSGYKNIIIHRNSGSSSAIGFWLSDSSLYAEVKNNGRTSQLSGSAFTLSLNKWQHVVLSLNSSGAVKMWLNGVSASLAGTVTGPFTDFNTSLFIGMHVSSQYFSGNIDNIRIYNTSVPASQIKEQYYAGLNRMLANGILNEKEYPNRILKINE